MAIYVRGVAASSRPANDPSFLLPVRYRLSCFTQRKCNLGIRDAEGRTSTSFEVDLWPAGNFYAFSAELPDGDEETDFVVDSIRAGYYGTHLSGELEHYREKSGYLDAHSINPSMVYLQPLPGGEDQHCWAEVDGEIDYQLQPGVFNTMWNYYESTQLAEPNINNYFPNYGDGATCYFQTSRCDHRVAPAITGPVGSGGSGWSGPDPLAPVSGDDVILQFPKKMTGRVQLLIARQGRLQGEISIGPSQMQSLKSQLFDYETKFGELRLPPDDDDDGGGAAA